MTEEKREKWLNLLALTTVILAVGATLSNFKGSSFSTRSVLAQSQAAEEWNYYQAKSIKGYLYEIQRDELQMELTALQAQSQPPQAQLDEYQQKIAFYSEKIQTYDEEKKTIQQNAMTLESNRDDYRKHSGRFGTAVMFLQIAILLSSIAALLKNKAVWVMGLLTGLGGMFFFVEGFLGLL